jgi:hypothetical protein
MRAPMAYLGRSQTRLSYKLDRARAGAGHDESESDSAEAYRAHIGHTWIGTGPPGTGTGMDVFDSDGAGAPYAAYLDWSRP